MAMADEEIDLLNTCSDLVVLEQFEAFPLHLLLHKQAGEWGKVLQLCLDVGIKIDDLNPDLFVTWLPDPMGQSDYSVVIFYDDQSKWTMAAHYNRQRVLSSASKKQAMPTTGVHLSGS
jgi:hypothetical protein